MAQTVALLDTTIQVDRVKTKTRKIRIESLLDEFDFKVATSIGLLEFKATVIRECVTIHNKLRRVGKYTVVVDRMTESLHPQAKLRGHIFHNLVNVFAPSSFVVTEEEDRKLAEKARLRLEFVIPRLYAWFRQSVDSVLQDDIACTRALDPPRKKIVAFEFLLPKCRRGENKFCRVESFIRSIDIRILDRLEEVARKTGDEQPSQLRRASDLFNEVLANHEVELSHAQCRSAGDCLIALEGMQHATHALSTNAKDWRHVSDLISCEFVNVSYPEEQSI